MGAALKCRGCGNDLDTVKLALGVMSGGYHCPTCGREFLQSRNGSPTVTVNAKTIGSFAPRPDAPASTVLGLIGNLARKRSDSIRTEQIQPIVPGQDVSRGGFSTPPGIRPSREVQWRRVLVLLMVALAGLSILAAVLIPRMLGR